MKKLLLLCSVFAFSPMSQATEVDMVRDLLAEGKITSEQAINLYEEIRIFNDLCNEEVDNNITTLAPAVVGQFWDLVEVLSSQ